MIVRDGDGSEERSGRVGIVVVSWGLDDGSYRGVWVRNIGFGSKLGGLWVRFIAWYTCLPGGYATPRGCWSRNRIHCSSWEFELVAHPNADPKGPSSSKRIEWWWTGRLSARMNL